MKLIGHDVKLDLQQKSAQVILYWRAVASMNTSYTVFVHLLDAQNKVVASGDAVPSNGEFPTTGWLENEYITDAHTLVLGDVPPGNYRIEIGVYDAAMRTRLKLSEGTERILFPPIQVP